MYHKSVYHVKNSLQEDLKFQTIPVITGRNVTTHDSMLVKIVTHSYTGGGGRFEVSGVSFSRSSMNSLWHRRPGWNHASISIMNELPGPFSLNMTQRPRALGPSPARLEARSLSVCAMLARSQAAVTTSRSAADKNTTLNRDVF